MGGGHEDTVTVTFNGQDKEIGYQPHASRELMGGLTVSLSTN